MSAIGAFRQFGGSFATVLWPGVLVSVAVAAAAEFVVGRSEGAVGRDRGPGADVDAVAGIEHASRIDDDIGADDDIPQASRRLDLDEGIDDGAALNDDARAPY